MKDMLREKSNNPNLKGGEQLELHPGPSVAPIPYCFPVAPRLLSLLCRVYSVMPVVSFHPFQHYFKSTRVGVLEFQMF